MRIYQDDLNGPWVAEQGDMVVTGDTREEAVNLLDEVTMGYKEGLRSIGRFEKRFDVIFNGFQFGIDGDCYLTLTDNQTKSTFMVTDLSQIREAQEKIRETFK